MPAAAAGFHDMEAPFGRGFALGWADAQALSDRVSDEDSSVVSRLGHSDDDESSHE